MCELREVFDSSKIVYEPQAGSCRGCEEANGLLVDKQTDYRYRRPYHPVQHDYGWAPGRERGAGVHENSKLELSGACMDYLKIGFCKGKSEMPLKGCTSEKSRPELSQCPDKYERRGHELYREAMQHIREVNDRARRSILLDGPVNPRSHTSADEDRSSCEPRLPDRRPLVMYHPRTFATSWRGLKHNLEPESYPQEVYGLPQYLDNHYMHDV